MDWYGYCDMDGRDDEVAPVCIASSGVDGGMGNNMEMIVVEWQRRLGNHRGWWFFKDVR